MTDFDRAMGRAHGRLSTLEDEIAAGAWQPTPETLTALVRHTLGIVAALHATIRPTATALCSS